MIDAIETAILNNSSRRLLFLLPTRLSALAARRDVGMRLGGISNARIESFEWLINLADSSSSALPNSLQTAMATRSFLAQSNNPDLSILKDQADTIELLSFAVSELMLARTPQENIRRLEQPVLAEVLHFIEESFDFPMKDNPYEITSELKSVLDEFDLVFCLVPPRSLNRCQTNILAFIKSQHKLPQVDLSLDAPSLSSALKGSSLTITPDSITEVQCAISKAIDCLNLGVAPNQIALLYPVSYPYANLVKSSLEASGLPYYGESLFRASTLPGYLACQDLIGLASDHAADDTIDKLLSLAVSSAQCRPELLGQFRKSRLTGSVQQIRESLQVDLYQSNTPLRNWLNEVQHLAENLAKAKSWKSFGACLDEAAAFFAGKNEGLSLVFLLLTSLESTILAPTSQDLLFALKLIGSNKLRPVQKLQQGIFYGTYESAVGIQFEELFGLGWQEQFIPGKRLENPFLTQPMREQLGLPTLANGTKIDEGQLASTIDSAQNSHLFFALSEPDGSREAFPSRYFLEQLNTRRPANTKLVAASHLKTRNALLGFQDCLQINSSVHAIQTLTPFSKSAALARDKMSRWIDVYQDPYIGIGFDERLGQAPVQVHENQVFGPTDLKAILECPLRFFFAVTLKHSYLAPKSPQWSLSPLEKGNLVHEVLRNWAILFTKQALGNNLNRWTGLGDLAGFAKISPAWSARIDKWLSAMPPELQNAESLDDAFDSIINFEFLKVEENHWVVKGPSWEGQKRILRRQLWQYIQSETALLCEAGALPILLEEPFQMPLLVQEKSIGLKGRLDRLDLRQDGSLAIKDYKTGKLPKPEKEPDFQLPIYSQAARQLDPRWESASIDASYVQPLRGEAAVAPEETLSFEQLQLRLRLVVETIESGMAVPRPSEDRGYCSYCAFRIACPESRHEIWESVQADPRWIRLAPLFQLQIRPEVEPSPSDEGFDQDTEAEPRKQDAGEASNWQPSLSRNPWESAVQSTAMLDSEARESAVNNTDHHTFIEAGAGSGKTTLLVDRICEALLNPENSVHPQNLVAITFTEKAAGELRSRLRDKLNEIINDAHPSRQEAAKWALANLDQARIGTIHSFCLDLLRNYGWKLNLPAYSVQPLDALGFEVEQQKFIVQLRKNPTETSKARWQTYFELEQDEKDAINFAKAIFNLSFFFLYDGLTLESSHEDPQQAKRNLIAALNAIQDFDEQRLDPRSKLRKFVQKLQALRSKDIETQIVEAIRIQEDIPNKPGNATGAKLESYQAAFQLYVEFSEAANSFLRANLEPLLQEFVDAAKLSAQTMVLNGQLPFDSQILCVKKLASDVVTAKEMSQDIHALFVDEFQDTDPHQAQIFQNLMESNPSMVSFFVGDPKQSIYGFRGADIDSYLEMKSLFQHSSLNSLSKKYQVLELNSNFRSRAAVLEWVNFSFQSRIEGYTSLQPCALDSGKEASPTVRILPIRKEGSASQIREEEFNDIANSILDLCGSEKQFQFQDAAILISSRSVLPSLLDKLSRHEIPIRLMVDSEILETEDAASLRSLIRYLANPLDSPAFVGSILSPLLGGRLKDLQISDAGDDLEDLDFLKILSRFAERCHGRSMTEIVEEIIEQFEIYSSGIQLPEYRDKVSRWKRFKLLAAEFDDSLGGSVADFATYLENLAEANAMHKITTTLEQDNDAVSIYTVQAAKGLEFPIVICSCLSHLHSNKDYPKLHTTPRNQLAWSLNKNLHSASSAEAQENAELKESKERWRLGYVAATRAKEVLIISLNANSRAKGSVAGQLQEDHKEFQCYTPPFGYQGETSLITADPLSWEVDWQKLAKTKGICTISPSKLVALSAELEALSEDWKDESASTPFDLRPSGDEGIRFGRAFHSLMQTHSLLTPATDHELSSRLAKEGLDHRLADLRQAEAAALRIIKPLCSKGRVIRETFLSAKFGEGLLEGYIDLLIEGPDGCTVVDYKTDKVQSAEDIETRFQHYRLQAGAYAAMLAESGKKVESVQFIFVMAGASSEEIPYVKVVNGEDLRKLEAAAKESAVQALSSLI